MKTKCNFIRFCFLSIFLIINLFSNVIAQKHTFTNNVGILKNYVTGESTESGDIDPITIENLGEGRYKFSDLKESAIFIYSHTEESMYIYKKENSQSILKCIQKLSLFAEGKAGKIILEIEGAAFELRYTLRN